MAKQEDVNLLCRGVVEWNKSRHETMDLSHLEIRNVDLTGADFRSVNFDGSRLSNSNLSKCDLSKARFNGVTAFLVDFSETNFFQCEMKGTDLIKCCLDKTKLDGIEAYLLKVRHSSFAFSVIHPSKLDQAHFYNCNFSGTSFSGRHFTNTNFKRAKIIKKHEDALKSLGVHFELPGHPTESEWVDFKAQTVPVEKSESGVIIHNYEAYWFSENRWDLFISYQSSQKEFVSELAEKLTGKGLKVWYDSNVLSVNESLTEGINFGLTSCPFGIIVISASYFGRKWTEHELKMLISKRIIVVLYKVQPLQVIAMYPELEDKIMLTSELGLESISKIIYEAIRRPPRNLVSIRN